MARPVVGIYASVAPASWGPWVDRPSVVAPAALGDAVQRAGAMAVLLAPDPQLERPELLGMLDALVALDDAEGVDAVVGLARERGLAVLVLEAARVEATGEDLARDIACLVST
jgi:hypothetical protein